MSVEKLNPNYNLEEARLQQLKSLFPEAVRDGDIDFDALREVLGLGDDDDSLEVDEGMMLEGISYDSWRSPSFTVEMETGTGKTYVYLRTIYELSKRYGFRKFIIIVPSTAIYEGVKKSFQIMYKHFASLYDNPVVNLTAYDSSQINRVKNFATSNFVEIMVMTNDSFNKLNNNLYKPSEKLSGELLPYQYIQQTKPILILDEPQSIDSTDLELP